MKAKKKTVQMDLDSKEKMEYEQEIPLGISRSFREKYCLKLL